MATLQDMLESYREANIRPGFDYRPFHKLPIMGVEEGSAIFGMRELVDRLKQEAADAGNTLYILPVQSWYRIVGNNIPTKKTLAQEAAQFSNWTGIPVLSSVVKVNYTANTFYGNGVSYFAGSLPPRSSVIIMDDLIGGGRTFRDMSRFIDGMGGKVAALSVIAWNDLCGDQPPTIRLDIDDLCFSVIYGGLNGIDDSKEAKQRYRSLPMEEKMSFIEQCHKAADPALNTVGLSFSQLLPNEFLRLVSNISCDPVIYPIKDLAAYFNSSIYKLPRSAVPNSEELFHPDELERFIVMGRQTPGAFISKPQEQVSQAR